MIVAAAKISNENRDTRRLPEVRRTHWQAGGRSEGRFESRRMIG